MKHMVGMAAALSLFVIVAPAAAHGEPGKTWRTRCTTPPNDPRKAILNTLVVATTDKRIDVIETGRYEIVLETGRCVADVKRTRAFDLVAEDKPGEPAAAPPHAVMAASRPMSRMDRRVVWVVM